MEYSKLFMGLLVIVVFGASVFYVTDRLGGGVVSGDVFPSDAVLGDWFFRSDWDKMCLYNGSVWLNLTIETMLDSYMLKADETHYTWSWISAQSVKSGTRGEGLYDWEDVDISSYVPTDTVCILLCYLMTPASVGGSSFCIIQSRPDNSSFDGSGARHSLDTSAVEGVETYSVAFPLDCVGQTFEFYMYVASGWSIEYTIYLVGYARYE